MDEVENDAPKFAKKHCETLGFEPAAYTLNGPFCALPLAAERMGPLCALPFAVLDLSMGGAPIYPSQQLFNMKFEIIQK